MKSAEEWANELLDDKPIGFTLVQRLADIQRDALKAAAMKVKEARGLEDRDLRERGVLPPGPPNSPHAVVESQWDWLDSEILALMPSGPDDA